MVNGALSASQVFNGALSSSLHYCKIKPRTAVLFNGPLSASKSFNGSLSADGALSPSPSLF